MKTNFSFRSTIIIVLIAVLLTASLFYVFAQTPTTTLTISGGIYPAAPSYTIYRVGNSYYAKDCNGQIDYTGTNISSISTSVLSALSSGGNIYFCSGNYIFDSSVYVPAHSSGSTEYGREIIISGAGWNTRLEAGGDSPIFNFNGSSQRVRNIIIENMAFWHNEQDTPLLRFYKADKIRINNCLFVMNYSSAATYGIYGEWSWDVIVYGCLFHGGGNSTNAQIYLYNGDTNNCNNWRFIACRFERSQAYDSLALHSDGTGAGSDNHNIHLENCKIHGANTAAFTGAAVLFNSTKRSSILNCWIAHHLGDIVTCDANCYHIEVAHNSFVTLASMGTPNSFVRMEGNHSIIENMMVEGSPTQAVLLDTTSGFNFVDSATIMNITAITLVTDNGADNTVR